MTETASLQFAGPEPQLIAHSQRESHLSQRVGTDDARPQPAQVALRCRGEALIELFGDQQVQHGVTQELQSLVVARPRTAMGQCGLEQRGVQRVVAELLAQPALGPVVAHADQLISTL
jgi:hypothetical protein